MKLYWHASNQNQDLNVDRDAEVARFYSETALVDASALDPLTDEAKPPKRSSRDEWHETGWEADSDEEERLAREEREEERMREFMGSFVTKTKTKRGGGGTGLGSQASSATPKKRGGKRTNQRGGITKWLKKGSAAGKVKKG